MSEPDPEPEPAPERPRRRSQLVFAALGVVLCLLLGLALATQVRQTESGDALDTARPADLLALLGSLQQREAAVEILDQYAFGDFELEAAGRQAGFQQDRMHQVNDVAVHELRG